MPLKAQIFKELNIFHEHFKKQYNANTWGRALNDRNETEQQRLMPIFLGSVAKLVAELAELRAMPENSLEQNDDIVQRDFNSLEKSYKYYIDLATSLQYMQVFKEYLSNNFTEDEKETISDIFDEIDYYIDLRQESIRETYLQQKKERDDKLKEKQARLSKISRNANETNSDEDAIIIRIYYSKRSESAVPLHKMGMNTDGHGSIEIISKNRESQYFSIYPDVNAAPFETNAIERAVGVPSNALRDAIVKTDYHIDKLSYGRYDKIVIPASAGVSVEKASAYLDKVMQKGKRITEANYSLDNEFKVHDRNCSYHPFKALQQATSGVVLPIFVITPNKLKNVAKILRARAPIQTLEQKTNVFIMKNILRIDDAFSYCNHALEKGQNLTVDQSELLVKYMNLYNSDELTVEYIKRNIAEIMALFKLIKEEVGAKDVEKILNEIEMFYAEIAQSTNQQLLASVIVSIKSDMAQDLNYAVYSALLDSIDPNGNQKSKIDSQGAEEDHTVLHGIISDMTAIGKSKNEHERIMMIESMITVITSTMNESNLSSSTHAFLNATKKALMSFRGDLLRPSIAPIKDIVDEFYSKEEIMDLSDILDARDRETGIAIRDDVITILSNEKLSFSQKIDEIKRCIGKNSSNQYVALRARAMMAAVLSSLNSGEISLEEATSYVAEAMKLVKSHSTDELKSLYMTLNALLMILRGQTNIVELSAVDTVAVKEFSADELSTVQWSQGYHVDLDAYDESAKVSLYYRKQSPLHQVYIKNKNVVLNKNVLKSDLQRNLYIDGKKRVCPEEWSQDGWMGVSDEHLDKFLAEYSLSQLPLGYDQEIAKLAETIVLYTDRRLPGMMELVTPYFALSAGAVFSTKPPMSAYAATGVGRELHIPFEAGAEAIIPGEVFVKAQQLSIGGVQISSVLASNRLLQAYLEYNVTKNADKSIHYPQLVVYGYEIISADGVLNNDNLKTAIQIAAQEEAAIIAAYESAYQQFKQICVGRNECARIKALVSKHTVTNKSKEQRVDEEGYAVCISTLMATTIYRDVTLILSDHKELIDCPQLLDAIVWCGNPELVSAIYNTLLAENRITQRSWIEAIASYHERTIHLATNLHYEKEQEATAIALYHQQQQQSVAAVMQRSEIKNHSASDNYEKWRTLYKQSLNAYKENLKPQDSDNMIADVYVRPVEERDPILQNGYNLIAAADSARSEENENDLTTVFKCATHYLQKSGLAGELSSDDKKEASAVTVRKNGELSEFSNAVHRLNQSNHSNVSAYAMIGIGLVIGAVAVTSMVMTAGLSAPLVLLAAAPVFSMIAVGVEKVITNKNREQAIVEHAKKVPSHAQRSVPMYADVSSSSATTARITEGKPLAKNRAVVWNENKKTCRDAQANETRPLLPAGTCSVG